MNKSKTLPSVRITEELLQSIKDFAADHNIKVSTLIVEAIESYIKNPGTE